MRRAVETIKTQPEMASIRTINLAVLAGEIRKLATAIHTEAQSAPSDDPRRLGGKAGGHLRGACPGRAQRRQRGRGIARQAADACASARAASPSRWISPSCCGTERKLLSIGYRVEEHQLDESCYDLLASEARLTSLFAIAKGDLPTEHWFRLGRPIVEIGFQRRADVLVGLDVRVSDAAAGDEGAAGRHPQPDQQSDHQAADPVWPLEGHSVGHFGSGLQRPRPRTDLPVHQFRRARPRAEARPGQNTVIAPYATVLAAQFKPREAVAEPGAAARDRRARPATAIYDAVDFTPQRVPEGTDHAVVYNYMAHHQGMSIVAVANVIFEGRMRDRFHSDPVIEAAELLLQEKAPRDIPIATVAPKPTNARNGRNRAESPTRGIVLDPAAGAAVDQRDVERPLFGDGDGDRLRLQPLGRYRR